MAFFLTLVGIFVVLSLVFSIWWYATIPSNLPPGPRGWPLIGSSLDTWRSSTLSKQMCKWAEIYGPLYKFYVGNKLIVVLGDWNTIQEALVKQADTFSGRPSFHMILPDEMVESGILSSEGQLWKTQRRFAISTFRDLGVGRSEIEPMIREEIEYMLEGFDKQNGRPFVPSSYLSTVTANIVSMLLFGKRFDHDDPKLQYILNATRAQLTETEFGFVTPFVLSKQAAKLVANLPQLKRVKQFNIKLISFVKEQIDEVLKNIQSSNDDDEPKNYIRAFYKAQQTQKENDHFNDRQMIASVTNLFLGATDTTVATLRFALFLMAHHPEIQEKIYEEIHKAIDTQSTIDYADRSKLPYTEAAILEIQRYAFMTSFSAMRRAMVPTKLCGYDIPADTIVLPLLATVLEDPKVYPNPKIFDPNRFLNGSKEAHTHLIPFSSGKRVCIGESLARMELFMIFTAIIRKFKISFPSDQPKPPLKAQYCILNVPVAHQICAVQRTN